MTVTSVGTPAIARSSASPVTSTWGAGQTRTAGNLLVAVVSAIAQTSVSSPPAPGGWIKPVSATAGGRCSLGIFTRVATGSDAAPSFTSTLSGTGALTATLFELTGQDMVTPLQTQGTQTGTTANPLTVTSAGTVAQSGSYAVCGTGLELTSAATDTETPLAGWSAAGDDSTTSDVVHTAVITQANPASAATLSGSVTWGAAGNSCAAVLAVFQPAPPATAVAARSTATLTAAVTSSPAASDPRDGTATVAAGVTSSPSVT